MKLIADSGSTKTDWCLVRGVDDVMRFNSQGINPFQQDAHTIEKIVSSGPLQSLPDAVQVDEIYFYGAGCRDEMCPMLRDIFTRCFPVANVIEINSDILAAARASFAHDEGIACILGTGSNSCLYDGSKIISNVSPLGYILGDEGSGAVLGRLFINAIFKGRLSPGVRNKFLRDSGLSLPEITNKVYREPMANRFLASLSVYIHKYLEDNSVEALVVDNFRDFFRKNVTLYQRKDVSVGAIGSIAFYYEKQLREAANMEGFHIEHIMKSPMDGLLVFHSANGLKV